MAARPPSPDPLVAATVRFQVTSLSRGLVGLVIFVNCVITRQTSLAANVGDTFLPPRMETGKGVPDLIGGTVKRITRHESLRRLA